MEKIYNDFKKVMENAAKNYAESYVNAIFESEENCLMWSKSQDIVDDVDETICGTMVDFDYFYVVENYMGNDDIETFYMLEEKGYDVGDILCSLVESEIKQHLIEVVDEVRNEYMDKIIDEIGERMLNVEDVMHNMTILYLENCREDLGDEFDLISSFADELYLNLLDDYEGSDFDTKISEWVEHHNYEIVELEKEII